MQGNTTEIDERNLLRLDALLSHGYGLSPQLVMRSKGLSIEAKALYGYLSSFAGAGDTAFPSTSRILEELDISKNRFYKIRKELVSWGFISIETTATSAGLRTVYTLPQNPIAIKTEIDEIANRRNEIKSSLVANLHNEDMVSHKGDSESERLQQSAGNEPCRQSEAKAQNRGSNLKPCLQSEDEGCLQSGDKLYIDTNINPKVSIDRSAAHPSDDEDAMHEDNNLLFSTSDVAKILAFSKMVEQELGKKIEHENDTPEKEQSQEHGQDQERQANARGWSDYPATPEQIDLTATVLAADEGVSIDEIKKDFSENPSIGELQIALEAKGHDTMAIQPDLKNYATPEQRAQLDMEISERHSSWQTRC